MQAGPRDLNAGPRFRTSIDGERQMVISHARLMCTSVALLAAVALTGCAQADTSDEGMTQTGGSLTLEQLLDEGLANSKSDFQTEVLTAARESGEISEADWKEGNNLRLQCLQEKGFDAELLYEGAEVYLQTDADPGAASPDEGDSELQAADLDCYEKTSAFINEAYSLINGGQSSVDPDEMQRAVLQCLIDRELVPADTTYEEFVADLEQNEGKQYSPQSTEANDPVAACWMENS
ncbi:hypothetical protein C5B97_00700 [Pseudoclavibacter sp. RFBB5]|nr:hypothetical protein C5B97_00700 [Pseudoclavibacter sp. RFBB5]